MCLYYDPSMKDGQMDLLFAPTVIISRFREKELDLVYAVFILVRLLLSGEGRVIYLYNSHSYTAIKGTLYPCSSFPFLYRNKLHEQLIYFQSRL